MSYSTFLIDLDHTLFDTDASEVAAFGEAMMAAGIADADRYLRDYQRINLELWAQVEQGDLATDSVRTLRFERLVSEFSIAADPLQLADEFVTALGTNGDLYDGAREVLETLSQKASLAMVTNGLGEVQRVRIERLGLDAFFDAIVISAEVGAAKPGKEIFEITFDALGRPERGSAVMVGDNLSSDIQGGIAFGIATCWYNPQRRSAAGNADITHEIRELDELLSLVAF